MSIEARTDSIVSAVASRKGANLDSYCVLVPGLNRAGNTVHLVLGGDDNRTWVGAFSTAPRRLLGFFQRRDMSIHDLQLIEFGCGFEAFSRKHGLLKLWEKLAELGEIKRGGETLYGPFFVIKREGTLTAVPRRPFAEVTPLQKLGEATDMFKNLLKELGVNIDSIVGPH